MTQASFFLGWPWALNSNEVLGQWEVTYPCSSAQLLLSGVPGLYRSFSLPHVGRQMSQLYMLS